MTIAGPTDSSVVPNYPRYRLVDLGTLGGPNSGLFATAKQLNNRGEAIAQADTTIPDPYAPTDCTDCLVSHGVVLEHNGLAGAVYILRHDRVHPLNIAFTQAMKNVSRWGSGCKDLVAAMESTKQPSATPEGEGIVSHKTGAREARVVIS
jgi:hypothetical protein